MMIVMNLKMTEMSLNCEEKEVLENRYSTLKRGSALDP